MTPRPSPEIVLCPHCGARNFAIDEACSSCSKPLTFFLGPKPKVRRLGLASLMAMIGVLAVCLGLLREAPGLGVAAALLLVPMTLRAAIDVESRKAEGKPVGWGDRNEAISSAILISVLMLPAAGIAFVATCVPVGCGALSAMGEGFIEPPGEVVGAWHPAMIVAVSAGLLLGIYVSYDLGRKFWPRKDA